MNTNEQVRLRPNDVLSVWHLDLCQQALSMNLYDADARDRWFTECRELLALVRDPSQRMAWKVVLASMLATGTPGLNVEVVMACLSLPSLTNMKESDHG